MNDLLRRAELDILNMIARFASQDTAVGAFRHEVRQIFSELQNASQSADLGDVGKAGASGLTETPNAESCSTQPPLHPKADQTDALALLDAESKPELLGGDDVSRAFWHCRRYVLSAYTVLCAAEINNQEEAKLLRIIDKGIAAYAALSNPGSNSTGVSRSSQDPPITTKETT